MRTPTVPLRWLSAALLLVTGCLSGKPNLRPPKRPEEFTLPPETEARFTKPIAFPEGTPNSSAPKKNRFGNTPNPMNSPSGFGVGGPGGMGGGGGMRPY